MMTVTITDGPESWQGQRVTLRSSDLETFTLIAIVDSELREAIYRIDSEGNVHFAGLAPKTVVGSH